MRDSMADSRLSADDPDRMTDIAAVRKRPGMYVGVIDNGSGLHNLIGVVISNAINEAIVGTATEIELRLNADGSCTVTDNGRGMPLDVWQQRVGAPESVMMRMIPTGFPRDLTDTFLPGRMHDMGFCVAVALSEHVDVRAWRNDRLHTLSFRDGDVESQLSSEPCTVGRCGTEVTLQPSRRVFGEPRYDTEKLRNRLIDGIAIRPDLAVSLTDNRHRPSDLPLEASP